MNHYDREDFNGVDFADDLLRSIEKDYGKSIMKIPKFKRIGSTLFEISIIFSDYRLLEAEINIAEIYGMPAIKVNGTYY
ncbi:hypothetical protein J7E63_15715 [Bacillus sp. ISL-75]|uniref:hypothetical protein n=1 Tax=Bacillus sp. ISL-75 TaxID=2819137 RepID=UPI001BE73002|nr:hypothetical protein [Bacillus sp. ISL-75]MBT2728376.1 hypothetical protein [Bacillus sp. ISL-75]